ADFGGAGGVHRGIRRKHALSRGCRRDDLATVALNPTVVFRAPPSAVAVDTSRDFSTLAVAFVPQRTVGGNQSFVHHCFLRVGHTFCNGPLCLQANRHPIEFIRPSIAPEVTASREKVIASQSGSDLRAIAFLAEIAELRRFGLLALEHSHHNPHTDQPVGHFRFSSRSCPRTLALGLLQQRDGHLHQRRQDRAGLGTSSHPWVLSRRFVSSLTEKT